jgi:hypothetical protein
MCACAHNNDEGQINSVPRFFIHTALPFSPSSSKWSQWSDCVTEWSCALSSALVLYIHKINATQESVTPKKGMAQLVYETQLAVSFFGVIFDSTTSGGRQRNDCFTA